MHSRADQLPLPALPLPSSQENGISILQKYKVWKGTVNVMYQTNKNTILILS